jgi:hypothetical protein
MIGGKDFAMNLPFRRLLPLAAGVILMFGTLQAVWLAQESEQQDTRLPNGKLQRDEILKAEHEANIKDVGRLVDLAGQLQQELEKNDRYVLSLSSLKKTDEIETLVKKIRARLRRN